MGVLNGIRAAVKRFHDTWVSPKEEPRREQPGALHIITPGGRIEITAVLGSKTDAQEIKRVLDILLNSEDELDTFIGGTD